MITGRGIEQIQLELTRQLSTKKDFIVPTAFLAFTVAGTLLNNKSGKDIPLSDYAHRQIGTFLDIPHTYYERMRSEQPALLSENVNKWMSLQKPDSRRLIRTLDGKCRAFLSDRYLPIDNHDVVKFLLPTIQEAGCEVVSAEITDKKMYIKALCPKIQGEVKVGDRVQAGILIQNSEIGCGRVEVSPLVYRLVCSNGLIVNELSQKRNHVGRRASDDDMLTSSIYSRETIMADIMTFLLKARDSVKAALDQAMFSKIVNKMKDATTQKLENAEDAIEDVTNRYVLSELESSAIMQNLINGGDCTKYGLVNAITLTAHKDVTEYTRSTELERIGGEVLFA